MLGFIPQTIPVYDVWARDLNLTTFLSPFFLVTLLFDPLLQGVFIVQIVPLFPNALSLESRVQYAPSALSTTLFKKSKANERHRTNGACHISY